MNLKRRHLPAALAAPGASRAAPAAGLRPLWIYGLHVPPMIEDRPSDAAGVVVDVVAEAMRRSGRKVHFRVLPWARAYEEVRLGRADGLIPTLWSAARERDLLFCEQPVFISEQMVFFRQQDGSGGWRGDLVQLQTRYGGKVRGVLIAPAFDQALAEGRLRCFEAANYEALVRMLADGRIDYAAMPRVIGSRVATTLGLDVVPAAPPLDVQFAKLAFTRAGDASEWKGPFDAALSSMWRDGTVAVILQRHGLRCDACLRHAG